MAKVIMFSREFPKYHPKAGQPTHFIEQFYNSIFSEFGDWSNAPGDGANYVVDLNTDISTQKGHTIRKGKRFKKGDFFSPRVWSGKPYRSKQITIAQDNEVLETWDYKMDNWGFIYINGKRFGNWNEIAKNDGLLPSDFAQWFIPNIKNFKGFEGQIICWSDKIQY